MDMNFDREKENAKNKIFSDYTLIPIKNELSLLLTSQKNKRKSILINENY
jgi:hypothetical protein